MKFFTKNFPEKLTSSILASEVVGKRVKLKQRGKEFQGLCPFHNEKSPSFTVNDQKGFYHCFGCQAHGNIIDFTMQTEGVEFRDAVVSLADNHGIAIDWQEENTSRAAAIAESKEDRELLLLEKICQIFEQNLKEAIGVNARNYLLNRGFNQEIIKKFRLGYALNSYDFLHDKLSKEGFKDTELLACGIIAKNNSGKLYDKLRNRVIFPILDKKNRVIAFGGRVLGDDLPKYLNSAETNIFKKGQTLYNISFARKAIFDEKFVVVVEGYADVIALAANGIENAVAGLGTALSKEHFADLFRVTDKILLCLDGDSAGINAAKRACDLVLPLISSKKTVEFLFLPDNLDPDDYLKKFGANSLKDQFKNRAINLSQALFDFALMDLALDKKSVIKPEDKAKIEGALTNKIELIKDNLLKKYFAQFFKDILFQISKKDFSYGSKSGSRSGSKAASVTRSRGSQDPQKLQNFMKIGAFSPATMDPKKHQAEILVQSIIVLIVTFPELAHYQDDKFDIKELIFFDEELTQIKDDLIEKIEESPDLSGKNLLLALENYAQNHYLARIQTLVDGAFEGFLKLEPSERRNKMRLLLMKNLLLGVVMQYEQALSKTDEIDTHQSAVNDPKITELFSYKNSLELEILKLEKELIQ